MSTMRAMRLHAPGQPLRLEQVPRPEPEAGQVQYRVLACGVCRTDLHVVDGELPSTVLPLVPGHEIVGEVTAVGADVQHLGVGMRIGVPWLGWTCGECEACLAGRENLCSHARFTGYTLAGGYAEYGCVPFGRRRSQKMTATPAARTKAPRLEVRLSASKPRPAG